MKRALITGINGQDGTYLYKYLLKNGYSVVGVDSKASSLSDSILVVNIDISNTQDVFDLLREKKPDEIYHLAAFHQSSEDESKGDLEVFKKSYNINVLSTINLLEGSYRFLKDTKLFYAASSYMFGIPELPVQNENSPFNPDCIYGITKYTGTKLCHYYRENYNVFASVGILYNHESPLRSSKFVSKKIVETAVSIKMNKKKNLVLGDLETEVDWGYAQDYVIAMQKILQLPAPDNFIISSGTKHKIKEFVEEAFNYLGLDWRKYVTVNHTLLLKKKKNSLFGDNKKIISLTGWSPSVSFKELVRIMVNAELEKYSKK